MEKIKAVVAIAIVALAVSFGVAMCIAGCDGTLGPPPCGPGTHEKDTVCVPDVPTTKCFPGEHFWGGKCHRMPVCMANIPANNICLPVCGKGTLVQNDQCVVPPPPPKTPPACEKDPTQGAFCVLGLGMLYWPGMLVCTPTGMECRPHCYAAEKCGNEVDDNCDGKVNEGCP